MSSFPLHLKEVPRLDWDKATGLIEPEYRVAWDWARYVLTKSHEELKVLLPQPQPIQEADLTDEDLRRAIEFGIVSEWSGPALMTCKVFRTRKGSKKNDCVSVGEPTLHIPW